MTNPAELIKLLRETHLTPLQIERLDALEAAITPAPEMNPLHAINWALQYGVGGMQHHEFLTDWQEGDLSEYPDYVKWAREQ